MKLVSYLRDGHDQLAVLFDGRLYDVETLHPDLPGSMTMFLQYWEESLPIVEQAGKMIASGRIPRENGVQFDGADLLAPVPFPTSFRIGHAFVQPGAPAPASSDHFPSFHFANHHSVQGAGDVVCMPDHLHKLDFELQVAIVICKPGKNIKAADADQYIGGYMILNDFSSRAIQEAEMKNNLGPAKGKDFATSLGPVLVTPDELASFQREAKAGHTGHNLELSMQCRVNGEKQCEGSLGDMEWTFAEIIERCSYGVLLQAGDVISSGPVNNGCFLQLNGHSGNEHWLKDGDIVELEVQGLGKLSNTITAEESSWSLFGRK